MITFSRLFVLFCIAIMSVQAQLVVQLKAEKEQFVAHEDINAILSITNRAGKTLSLKGSGRINWLDINMYDQSGDIMTYRVKDVTFKAATLAAGQTIQKKITVSDFYDLTRYGAYRAEAVVRISGNDREGFRSNSARFLITTGRVIFSQSIGVPNTNTARKYEVMNFPGAKHTELYVKVTNGYNNRVVSCQSLGQVINFRKPQVALDGKNHLNIFYLIQPTLFAHVIIDPTGRILKRNYHRQGNAGEPRLEAFANGDVKVGGTVPYDPKKAKEDAQKQRKLSDRPGFVY